MRLTLTIDAQLVERARKLARAMGKSLNQLVREYVRELAATDDPQRDIEELRRLSGRGHSRGWKYNRDEMHERS